MAFVSQSFAATAFAHWLEAIVVVALLTVSVLLFVVQRTVRRPAVSASAASSSPAAASDLPPALQAEQLCALIQETTKLDPHRKPGAEARSALVQSIFQLESVAILDVDLHEVYRAGEWFDEVQDVLQNICTFETSSDDTETGLSRRVLRMGNLPIGAMLLRGETHGRMASAIGSVIAITFDRYHALANESRTESARQTELLRTTVLDSLAHAYKTPLTAIGAANEGLSALGHLTPAQMGLVTLIEEQTALLNQLTTRLLKTARLQASEMTPHAEKVVVAPLIEDVVASLRDQLTDVPVKIAVSSDDLSLRCDRSLLVALLTQYVDNAAKYGASGTPVTIKAAEHAAEVIFSVHSIWTTIPPSDFERIFDRYYRSSILANKAPGTGIGLSVAKRTAQAQGGHVWVTSDFERGTTFYASLPALPPVAAPPLITQGSARL